MGCGNFQGWCGDDDNSTTVGGREQGDDTDSITVGGRGKGVMLIVLL